MPPFHRDQIQEDTENMMMATVTLHSSVSLHHELFSNPSFSQSRFLVAMVMIIGGMNLKCCIRRRSEWGKFGGLTGGESNKGTKEGAAQEKETYFDFKTRIWASGGNQKCELLLQI